MAPAPSKQKPTSFAVATLGLGLLMVISTVGTARADFGLTTSTSAYNVDTGGGLVFTVDRANGGIPSITWNGTELNIKAKSSGIASGLGPNGTSVTATANPNTIIITVSTDSTNRVVANLTHYYIVQKGVNNIYMATYAAAEPTVGELRWITRLQSDLFPKAPPSSDCRGTTGAIESKDVFGNADGTTRSKYYGNQHAKDLSIRGVTGPGRGVFMAYGNRESSSGGPFYRDIQNQTTEVYNYMNSGHAQAEPWRIGVLHGPYALCFTSGEVPAMPDMGFISSFKLKGYVESSERGKVTCSSVTGRDKHYPYTVGFSNNTAQYWTDINAENGAFSMEGMIAGTYTMQIYKNELSVYTAHSVTVSPGRTNALASIAITEDPSTSPPLWRIGDWDGTPNEFLNSDKVPCMHPSDSRISTWNPGPFTVGTSSPKTGIPCYQWKGVPGENQIICFNLTANQIASSIVRVGITTAFAKARPDIQVNSWTAPGQPASIQPRTRTLTVGSYRGMNTTYTFSVPASALVVGTNALRLYPVSGNGGTNFLGAGYSLDCIDFLQGAAK